MALENAFGELALDATLQEVRDRLPAGADFASETSLAAMLVVLGTLSTGAKQDTAQAALNAINASTDGIEALLAAIDGHVDGVEGLLTTTNARLAAAAATALPGASGDITAGAATLLGYTLRETAGGTAVVRLRDGNAGTHLATVSLAASESTRDWFGPSGVAAATKVYYEKVSGTVEGAVFTR